MHASGVCNYMYHGRSMPGATDFKGRAGTNLHCVSPSDPKSYLSSVNITWTKLAYDCCCEIKIFNAL